MSGDRRSAQQVVVPPEAMAVGIAVCNQWMASREEPRVPIEVWFGLAALRGMEARAASPVVHALTPRQLTLFEFIKAFIAAHGYSPTYQEMVEHLGGTRPKHHATVTRLVERGAVRRLPHRSRAIELVAA
jgi:hypothetical protein